jgi:hypothetical protein
VRGERQEADIGTTPTWVLERSPFEHQLLVPWLLRCLPKAIRFDHLSPKLIKSAEPSAGGS